MALKKYKRRKRRRRRRMATSKIFVLSILGAVAHQVPDDGDVPFLTASRKIDTLTGLLSAFPTLAKLYNLGNLEGATVFALVVSASASKRAFLVPRVQLMSDFPVGDDLLVRLAWHLMKGRANDSAIEALLSNTEVHLLFWMHEDHSQDAAKTCKSEGGVVKLFNLDVENDKADNLSGALKTWYREGRLVLNAILHNRPANPEIIPPRGKTALLPDQDVFSYLSDAFATRQGEVISGTCSPANVTATRDMSTRRPIRSSTWKNTYSHRGTLQMLLPVTCCAALQKNQELGWAMATVILDFVLMSAGGVRGYIKDVDGTLVSRALVAIKGRNVGFWSSDQGEFWRILRPGKYVVIVAAKGYLPGMERFTVTEGAVWEAPVTVTLARAPPTITVSSLPTGIGKTIPRSMSREKREKTGEKASANQLRACRITSLLLFWCLFTHITYEKHN